MNGTFDHIINWRLLKGGHEFPGPDGGTCINEAAVVAAGLPYRSVKRVDDLPSCFSKTMGQYLLMLNDGMPEEHRQSLMPFVMRLAGSRDTGEVEIKRARHLVDEVVKRLVQPVLGYHGLSGPLHVIRVAIGQGTRSAAQAGFRSIGREIAPQSRGVTARACAMRHVESAVTDLEYAYARSHEPLYLATHAASAIWGFAQSSSALEPLCYTVAVEIGLEALDIGQKSPVIPVSLIAKRLDEAKANAVGLVPA